MILNLFSLMLDAGVPDIALEPDKTVQKVCMYERSLQCSAAWASVGHTACVLPQENSFTKLLQSCLLIKCGFHLIGGSDILVKLSSGNENLENYTAHNF